MTVTNDQNAELAWAKKLHQADLLDEASEKYAEILDADPNHAEAGFLLGTIEFSANNLGKAAQHLTIGVLGLDHPEDAQKYLAQVLQISSVTERKLYSEWLTQTASFSAQANGVVALLRVLRLCGLPNEARHLSESKLDHFKNDLKFLKQYGAIQFEFGQFQESLAAYETVYAAIPDNLEISIAYASALGKAAQVEKALKIMLEASQALRNVVDSSMRRAVLSHLLQCFNHLELKTNAVTFFEEFTLRNPEFSEGWACLARAQRAIGQSENARLSVTEGLSKTGPDVELIWLQTFFELKPIYDSSEEIANQRERYRQRLTDLSQKLKGANDEDRSRALMLAGETTPYLLPYQGGKDDKDLQQIYGSMLVDLVNSGKDVLAPASGKHAPLRHVMFVSEFVWRHTNWRMKRSWLKFLDRERFKVSCLHLGQNTDEMTEEIKGYSDDFYHIPLNIDAAKRLIRETAPDVIFYPEVGMSGIVQLLATQRLASVQCCGIGHPVTTGLPTIDYFVSGYLIEPVDAHGQYCEELITLPGISFPYLPSPLDGPAFDRSDFGLDDSDIVYLCLQTPQKYLPHDDYLYAQIATEVDRSKFVFLEGGSEVFDMSIMKKRLREAFAEAGVDFENHVRFLPHLSPEKYQALNTLGDIALDTPEWSGGNTTLEALYQGLPVVTLPGGSMRSRVSAGMLSLMDVKDTIAADRNAFIEIGVRLGKDPDWRYSIAERLKEQRSILETDMACMRAMEDFLEHAVKKTETLDHTPAS